MADDWDAFPEAPVEAPQPAQQSSQWAQFPQAKTMGTFLPMSRNADGSMNWFDPDAGFVGALKSAVTLPGDVATGKVQEGSPEWVGRTVGMASMTAPGDMLAPGVSGLPAKVAAPTAQELHAAANEGYGALRNMGVHYDLDRVGSMVQGAQDALGNLGLSSEVAPQTHAVLNRLGNPPSEAVSVPLTGLANTRSILGRIGQGPNPVDRLASKKAISAIDDFIQNPPPEAVLDGDPTAAADTLRTANGNYAAAKRSDKLNAAGDYAQFRADSAHSGANFDNSLRQQVRPLIDPRYPQRLNGFTPPEKEAITNVVEGNPVRNTLRTAGNILGGGGGMHSYLAGMGGATAGYEAAGFPGAVVGLGTPLVGAAAKYGQNKMGRAALESADELIRSRSPLAQARQEATPQDIPANPKTIAATRAGIASGAMPENNAGYAPTLGAPLNPNQFYAKGGKVKKPSHEYLVNRLMALAERAKRAEKKRTAPILNMPDDHVTAALAKAQEAI